MNLRIAVLALGFAFGLDASEPSIPPRKPELPAPYFSYELGPPTSSHRTITIEEAIAAALAHASQAQIADIDVLIAEQDLAQSRAGLLPVLSAPLLYYGNTPSSLRTPGEPDVPSFAPSTGVNETSAFLSVAGSLDLNGSQRAQIRQSRELLHAARSGAEEARRDLVVATIDAYQDLALARQLRRLADETLALAEGFAELTRELNQRKETDETELLRARAEALRLRDELELRRVEESVAMNALRSLTGIGFSTHIGVARPSENLPPLSELTIDPEALDRWPGLERIRATRLAAIAEEQAVRRSRFPQPSYAFNYGFDTVDISDVRRYSGGSVLLGVDIPLFDFGARASRQTQASLRVRQLDAERSIRLRELASELFSVRTGALAARERIRMARERASASERALTLILERYRSRKVDLTDVIDAQSGYADSRVSFFQAITDYQKLRARLARDPAALDFKPGQPAEAAPPREECRASLAESPSLHGLRLGMALKDVRGHFPSAATQSLGDIGITALTIEGSFLNQPSEPAFRIVRASLQFVGDQLAYIRMTYSGDVTWQSKDSFLAAAVEALDLPRGPWRSFYDWRDKNLEDAEDLREQAVECEGFSIRLGLGYASEGVTRQLTPHIELQDSILWDVAKRRASDRQRQGESPSPQPSP